MKTQNLIFCVLFSALCFRASAQYRIDWFTVDGGGAGRSGDYSITGTIGQADASTTTLTGGQYSLTGGFWAVYAVQTPGAPLLGVFRTPTNTVAVSWPSPSTDWELEQNSDLNTTNWVLSPDTIYNDGTNKFIIVSPPNGNCFYRLHKQ